MKPPQKFKTLYADPPWKELGGGKIKRGADRHYPLMSLKKILAMAPQIRNLCAENCHLYLWVTNNFLQDGLAVLNKWGFTYITTITWTKDRFGLGYYFRGQTEHCLFGRKGMLKPKHKDFDQSKYEEQRWSGTKQKEGVITPTTSITAPRTKHSAKPEKMRQMIETVSWPPYLELFARSSFPGWSVWGNEVDSDITLPVTKNVETFRATTDFAGGGHRPNENLPHVSESRQKPSYIIEKQKIINEAVAKLKARKKGETKNENSG